MKRPIKKFVPSLAIYSISKEESVIAKNKADFALAAKDANKWQKELLARREWFKRHSQQFPELVDFSDYAYIEDAEYGVYCAVEELREKRAILLEIAA